MNIVERIGCLQLRKFSTYTKSQYLAIEKGNKTLNLSFKNVRKMKQSFSLQYHFISLGIFVDPFPHFSPESVFISHVVVCGFDVEGVIKVEEVAEEAVEAPDDVLEAARGRPARPIHGVLPEDRQADFPVFVYIGVPQLREAFGLWRGNVVLFSHLNVKFKFSSQPVALLGHYGKDKVVERVGVVELDLAAHGKVLLHLLNLFH